MGFTRGWLAALTLLSATFAPAPASAQTPGVVNDMNAALSQCGLEMSQIGPVYLYVQKFYLQERLGGDGGVGEHVNFHPQAGTKVGDGMFCVQRIAHADAAKDASSAPAAPTAEQTAAIESSPEFLKAKADFDTCDKHIAAESTVITACNDVLGSRFLIEKFRPYMLLSRGMAYAGSHDYARAIADYDQGIQLNSGIDMLWANRGMAYWNQNNLPAAISDLSRATQITPGEPNMWLRLAQAQNSAQQYPAAIASYDRGIALKPRDDEALNTACWLRAITRTGLAQALDYCNRSIAIKADPNTFDSRGLVRLLMGDNAGAAADYDVAVRGDPQAAGSLYGRGVARIRLSQMVGHADLEQALRMDPSVRAKYADRGVTLPVPVMAAPTPSGRAGGGSSSSSAAAYAPPPPAAAAPADSLHRHHPENEATNCLSLSTGGKHQLENHCAFPVTALWCVMNKECGHGGNEWTIAAHGSYPVFGIDEQHREVWFGGCKGKDGIWNSPKPMTLICR